MIYWGLVKAFKLRPVEIRAELSLTFEEICVNKGYSVESRNVTTKDGYILNLFRIGKGKISNGPPVIMVHGLTQTSHSFILNRSATAPAFLLADHGYDVWMLNTRGTYLSRNHIGLDPCNSKYWDWTAHEISLHDLPTSIDYVLEKTQYSKLNYIGHSQGGHILLNCLSYMPEYNHKINVASLLAPFGGQIAGKSPYFQKIVSPFNLWKLSINKVNYIGGYSKTPAIKILFADKYKDYFQKIYKDRYDVAFHNDTNEHIAYYISRMGGSTSVTNLKHYAKMMEIQSPIPIAYDYGAPWKNFLKYGQETPPRADFNKISANLAIFFGTHDQICTKQNGENLIRNLPKSCILYQDLNCKQDHSGFLLSPNQVHLEKSLELMDSNRIFKLPNKGE